MGTGHKFSARRAEKLSQLVGETIIIADNEGKTRQVEVTYVPHSEARQNKTAGFYFDGLHLPLRAIESIDVDKKEVHFKEEPYGYTGRTVNSGKSMRVTEHALDSLFQEQEAGVAR